jgi:hypothetical protein
MNKNDHQTQTIYKQNCTKKQQTSKGGILLCVTLDDVMGVISFSIFVEPWRAFPMNYMPPSDDDFSLEHDNMKEFTQIDVRQNSNYV